MTNVEDLIAKLQLQPHPKEGGFFRETYRSSESFDAAKLPARYGAPRSVSTAIYYLLTPGTFSALHLLQSDEVFHFYAGQPVKMLQLWADGSGKEVILGADLIKGESPQVVVQRGVWQGSFLMPGGEFARSWVARSRRDLTLPIISMVSAELTAKYPAFAELIKRLTTD